MSIKLEFKSRKDKVRVCLMGIATLAGIIMSIVLFPELLWVYLVFGTGSIFTIEYRFKHTWPLDIAFPALSALTTLYIDHLISMIGKSYFSDVHSIIKYLIDKGFMKVEIEIVFVISLYWILRVCCVPKKVAAFVCPIPMLFLSVTNYYVYSFRGSILIPTDIFAAKTAANVVSNYHFPIYTPLATAVIPFILLIVSFGHFKITNPREKWYIREIMCAFLAFFSILFGYVFFTEVMCIMPGYSFNYMGTAMNGYISNFFLLARDSRVKVPTRYAEYRERFEEMSVEADSAPEDTPNILVIMNESYCDTSIYQDLWSDYYDPDPFLDSLDTGTAFSSVFGGQTPNSEFSFLTGLPTAFLPDGTTPYSMYIDSDEYSLARYLKQFGYNTCAMHPFLPTGWERDRVYPMLGFDEFLSLDDYDPSEDDLVRDYISDRYAYDYAVDYIEAQPDGTPSFVFLVTMQNHGGYDLDERLYDHPMLHSADTGDIDEFATTYFALINESDKALEHLFERLSESEERYIVLMFGDHQPQTGIQVDLEPGGSGWEVPYVIWANYPVSYTQDHELTSLNYLSLDLLEAADLPLSEYYRYLESIRSEVPALNSSGFYYEGAWHPIMEANGLRPMDAYRSLQYYYLFEDNC
ncbi:MAG: LTA synthase family protein [Clostridiales bacterium]|nr:LTA synthase family protein [Clostridiales bacterium]